MGLIWIQLWSSGTSVSKFNLLEEPSPLGLSLRKSPSLQELIQMRLSQSGDDTNSCVKKESMSIGVGTGEKLKASNFPAMVLRIGQWEVSFQILCFLLEFCVLESKFDFCL